MIISNGDAFKQARLASETIKHGLLLFDYPVRRKRGPSRIAEESVIGWENGLVRQLIESDLLSKQKKPKQLRIVLKIISNDETCELEFVWSPANLIDSAQQFSVKGSSKELQVMLKHFPLGTIEFKRSTSLTLTTNWKRLVLIHLWSYPAASLAWMIELSDSKSICDGTEEIVPFQLQLADGSDWNQLQILRWVFRVNTLWRVPLMKRNQWENADWWNKRLDWLNPPGRLGRLR